MKKIEKVAPFLPQDLIPFVADLICDKDDLEITIAKPRFTKWGDFRKINGHAVISINSNLNPYQFLITLLHEFAHYVTYRKYGKTVKPHGKEWKKEFGNILLELIKTDKLPYELNRTLVHYSTNPRAAVTTDLKLKHALERYSLSTTIKPTVIDELEIGEKFIFNGRLFERHEKRRKLVKCKDVKKNKFYLFQPDTVVKKI
jgi:hypothetical protein